MSHNFLSILHLTTQIIKIITLFSCIQCFRVGLIYEMIPCLGGELHYIGWCFFDKVGSVLLTFGLMMKMGSSSAESCGSYRISCHQDGKYKL